MPTSTPAPEPTSTPQPVAVCSCSGNLYNCSDFGTHAAAQACFDYCVQQGRGDIHRLDGDSDGDACESLP
jgi:micrococcal nuclease